MFRPKWFERKTLQKRTDVESHVVPLIVNIWIAVNTSNENTIHFQVCSYSSDTFFADIDIEPHICIEYVNLYLHIAASGWYKRDVIS